MTKDELMILKNALPFGSQKRISDILGISLQAVGQALSGKSKNEDVVEQAFLILEEEKRKAEDQSQRLSGLI